MNKPTVGGVVRLSNACVWHRIAKVVGSSLWFLCVQPPSMWGEFIQGQVTWWYGTFAAELPPGATLCKRCARREKGKEVSK